MSDFIKLDDAVKLLDEMCLATPKTDPHGVVLYWHDVRVNLCKCIPTYEFTEEDAIKHEPKTMVRKDTYKWAKERG